MHDNLLTCYCIALVLMLIFFLWSETRHKFWFVGNYLRLQSLRIIAIKIHLVNYRVCYSVANLIECCPCFKNNLDINCYRIYEMPKENDTALKLYSVKCIDTSRAMTSWAIENFSMIFKLKEAFSSIRKELSLWPILSVCIYSSSIWSSWGDILNGE